MVAPGGGHVWLLRGMCGCSQGGMRGCSGRGGAFVVASALKVKAAHCSTLGAKLKPV